MDVQESPVEIDFESSKVRRAIAAWLQTMWKYADADDPKTYPDVGEHVYFSVHPKRAGRIAEVTSHWRGFRKKNRRQVFCFQTQHHAYTEGWWRPIFSDTDCPLAGREYNYDE